MLTAEMNELAFRRNCINAIGRIENILRSFMLSIILFLFFSRLEVNRIKLTSCSLNLQLLHNV